MEVNKNETFEKRIEDQVKLLENAGFEKRGDGFRWERGYIEVMFYQGNASRRDYIRVTMPNVVLGTELRSGGLFDAGDGYLNMIHKGRTVLFDVFIPPEKSKK